MKGSAASAVGTTRALLAALVLAAVLPAAADSPEPNVSASDPEAAAPETPAPEAPQEQSITPALSIRGVALGAGGGGGAALTRSPYFPLKAQPWYAVGLDLEVPLIRWLGLGFGLSFRGTGPSNAAAGFLYRGHHGLDAILFAYGRGRLSRAGNRLDLIGGIAAGASANFEVYSMTELLFFYPSLLLEPYLEFHFPRMGRHTFSLCLPARLDFRKDLDLSASVGLGLRWRWYPGWKKEGV
jgi:hypothetical protein